MSSILLFNDDLQYISIFFYCIFWYTLVYIGILSIAFNYNFYVLISVSFLIFICFPIRLFLIKYTFNTLCMFVTHEKKKYFMFQALYFYFLLLLFFHEYFLQYIFVLKNNMPLNIM